MSEKNQLTRYERARNWLARTEINLPAVSVVKYGGSLAGLAGPLFVGFVTMDPKMSLMSALVYASGLGASFLGPLLNQGAASIEQTTRRKLTHDHSFNLTAAISLLREVQSERFDGVRFQHQILKEIASTVMTVARSSGAKVLACLLVKDGEQLELIGWSDHREGRIPSASIPLAAEVGAALTFRTGKTQHVPDVREVDGEDFTGKAYRSVLTFPVKVQDRVVGVVAVDSTEAHHFDHWLVDLDVHVRPFVELISFSVAVPRPRT